MYNARKLAAAEHHSKLRELVARMHSVVRVDCWQSTPDNDVIFCN